MSPRRQVPFPDDQQILLLRAALLGGEDAIDAWEHWKHVGGGLEGHDSPSFRLLPLLYRNLSALGVNGPEMRKLRGVYRYAWYRNQDLFQGAASVIRDLTEARVETLALKGAALTVLYYRDGGTRPMDDFDLLVPFRDAKRALLVLRDGGWTLDSTLPLEQMLVVGHAISCRDRAQHQLDLHWRALYEPASDDSFWANSVPVEVRGARTRALCAEHQLIHVCIHGMGFFPGPVRWLADALTVMNGAGSRLDWDVVVKEARDRRVTVTLNAALRFLVQAFGVSVPRDTLAGLARPKARVDERLAHRAAMSPRHGRFFVLEWYRHRRLRHLDLAPKGFLVHLQYMWGLTSRRQVLGRLARKVLQVARYGHSHPSGERMLRG